MKMTPPVRTSDKVRPSRKPKAPQEDRPLREFHSHSEVEQSGPGFADYDSKQFWMLEDRPARLIEPGDRYIVHGAHEDVRRLHEALKRVVLPRGVTPHSPVTIFRPRPGFRSSGGYVA